jgi:hypothetical protein
LPAVIVAATLTNAVSAGKPRLERPERRQRLENAAGFFLSPEIKAQY